jgi:hypothetical protein
MRNFWLVAKHEYRSVVARRGFVLLTAAIPLGLVAIVGLTILVQQGNQTSLALGYVDQAGILDAGRRAALPTLKPHRLPWKASRSRPSLCSLQNTLSHCAPICTT